MNIKTLFLIDGAAGSGKTDLLSFVSAKYGPGRTATVISKFTTRNRRPEEAHRRVVLDLDFITNDEFNNRVSRDKCYTYQYGTSRYGFRQRDLDEALRTHACVFVIVRNRDLIDELRKAYADRAHVVAVYVHSDRAEIQRRLKEDGYDQKAITFRLQRQELVWSDYLRHPEVYDEVLINNSAKTDFGRLIERLITKHTSNPADMLALCPGAEFQLPPALIGFRATMLEKLATSQYEKNVFLMMKFRSGNRLVYEFIAEKVRSKGFNCVRADERHWNITSNVYNPVAVLHCCKYGIALFDEPEDRNDFSPNVAYELGMMHLQRKRCLILRHDKLGAIPFDLIKDLHKTYGKELELHKLVTDWIDEIAPAAV